METKIINVSIGRTIEATQYDAGQVLVFDGIDIPDGSEAHFSNQKINEKTVINNNQCDIPDNILQIGGKGMLSVYVINEDSSRTVYDFLILIKKRAELPEGIAPEHQQSFEEKVMGIFNNTKSLAESAKKEAQSVREDADAGLFDGRDGADGYTPVKGTDYFTDAEINQIKNDTREQVVTEITPSLENNLKTAKDYTNNAIIRDFKDITYDETTATFVFTRHDNTTFTVDLPIEQTVEDGRYDDETAELVLVLVSGQEIRIPVTGLIDDYTGVDSATIQVVISADNKITCNIIGGTISKTLLTTELQEEIDRKANKSEMSNLVQEVGGKLSELATTDKESYVAAINELEEDVSQLKGDLNNLDIKIGNVLLQYSLGGINGSTGVITTTSNPDTRIHSTVLDITENDYRIILKNDTVKFAVHWYNGTTYLGNTGYQTNNIGSCNNIKATIAYIVCGYVDDRNMVTQDDVNTLGKMFTIEKIDNIFTSVDENSITTSLVNPVIDLIGNTSINTNKNVGDELTPIQQYTFNNYSAIIPCTEGDLFLLNGKGGVNSVLYVFLNNENQVIAKANPNFTANDLVIKAPYTAKKLLLNTAVLAKSYKLTINTSIANIKELTKPFVSAKGEIFTPLIQNTMNSFLNGIKFTEDLNNHITDFAKTGDLMVHVSTFCIINDVIYMTYYANTRSSQENPTEQTARFVYCSISDLNNKTFIDLQDVGETFDGKTVTAIYDTILLRKDDDVLYLAWTAQIDGVYCRLYRTYTISTGTLSDIMTNNFKVGNTTKQFSTTGMNEAFAINSINHKLLDGDIGIMQKLSSRVENGTTYYYTGAYVGTFNCIIKSSDLVTWEFVAQPSFKNNSLWENSVYVINDKVFYFCRQGFNTQYGFLTYYDLATKTWCNPLLIPDCQSRSDFFYYNNNLYLIHAPNSRNMLEIIRIDTNTLGHSEPIQSAVLNDCFYPFIQSYNNDMYISFTQSRKHIWLSKFEIKPITVTNMITKFKTLFY